MTGFADLAHLPEDKRIEIIGSGAEDGGIIGFVVETDTKADRYLRKLLARYRVRLIGRGRGPVEGSVLVRIGPALPVPTPDAVPSVAERHRAYNDHLDTCRQCHDHPFHQCAIGAQLLRAAAQ